MTPRITFDSRVIERWYFVVFCVLPAIGCTSTLLTSPASDVTVDVEAIETELADDIQLIKDVTTPSGMHYIKLESVALVTGLKGAGSDPPPSPQRTALVADMQARQVKDPNRVLASPDTSLVLVRAFLPPGIRKGGRFDVEVRVPGRSETASLRNGWLMQTRLREVALLNDTLRTGRVEGVVEGSVIVDAAFEGDDDEVSQVRGRVLGGGVARSSRSLGLRVHTENHSIKTSSLVGTAINARFHTYDRGAKKGVATPKRDSFVSLEVHPRYRHNLARYMRVVRNIALAESPGDRIHRLELLERKLFEPATSAAAAIQLEAIGKEAVSVLHRGLRSEDPEVCFFAAEALAYIDEAEAAEPLAEAAKNEPAFRWHAIAALCAMDHVSAHDALSRLLHVSSAETRYAAFRALSTRNALDSVVRGEQLGEEFSYHPIRSSGPAMVHFSRSKRPEVVTFGDDLHLRPPSFLYAGKNIMLKDAGQDRIKVVRFAAREEDEQEYCSTRLDDVIRTIVKLDGGYADVLQCINEAKAKGYLDARVVIDALPRQGRSYRREATGETASGPARDASGPLPEMFTNLLSARDNEDDEASDIGVSPHEDGETANGFREWLGSWFGGE